MQEQIKNNSLYVLCFCGQSVDWNKNSLLLYYNDLKFKTRLDEYDKKLSFYFGFSMIDKFNKAIDFPNIKEDQHFTHGMLFIYQVTLYYYLYDRTNIIPGIIFGVSCGEVAALHCSEIIDFETACYILYNRSTILLKTISFGGMMIASRLNETQFNNEYKDKSLEIVAYISPRSTLIGGKKDDILNLKNKLDCNNIQNKIINQSACFHNKHLEIIKDDILKLDFKSKNPITNVISCPNLKYFNDNYKYDKYHVYENIRQSCKILQVYQEIFKFAENNSYSNIIFNEIAPNSYLSGLFIIDDILPNTKLNYLSNKSIHIIPTNFSKDISLINNDINNIIKLYNNK